MKTKINSINDALAFMLQGLYFTETRVKEAFPSYCNAVSSPEIKVEISSYMTSCNDKLLKIERIFNYLLTERVSRTNDVINELIIETHQMLASTTSSHLRDVLTIGSVQNINAYKISGYRSAYMFAVALELDTVTDLLQQILEWEIETSKVLYELSIVEFNKTQNTTTKIQYHAWDIDS